MIDFDFSYYRPTTPEEAIGLYHELNSDRKKPIYYSGGTELITKARAGEIQFDAVIDIKDILACNACQFEGDELVIGAGVTMTKVAESGLFPFLTAVLKGIGDHTSRNKITIGGNVCSNLMYREAVLPFLLGDSWVVIAGKNGTRQDYIKNVFDQSLHLRDGELLLQIRAKKQVTEMPFVHIRKTRQTKIDYPLLTLAMTRTNQEIRVAVSGYYQFPIRFESVEKVLGDSKLDIRKRVDLVMNELSGGIVEDRLGSAAYRKLLFRQGLIDALIRMEAIAK